MGGQWGLPGQAAFVAETACLHCHCLPLSNPSVASALAQAELQSNIPAAGTHLAPQKLYQKKKLGFPASVTESE